mmetsp:Transcript_56800/g.151580  ORF Transcript_56800/g.151580 Transcript_56800/m.151580 type:complete len:256 (+) Transcript_56800:280-1047(+)
MSLVSSSSSAGFSASLPSSSSRFTSPSSPASLSAFLLSPSGDLSPAVSGWSSSFWSVPFFPGSDWAGSSSAGGISSSFCSAGGGFGASWLALVPSSAGWPSSWVPVASCRFIQAGVFRFCGLALRVSTCGVLSEIGFGASGCEPRGLRERSALAVTEEALGTAVKPSLNGPTRLRTSRHRDIRTAVGFRQLVISPARITIRCSSSVKTANMSLTRSSAQRIIQRSGVFNRGSPGRGWRLFAAFAMMVARSGGPAA